MPSLKDNGLNPGHKDYESKFDPENRPDLYKSGDPLSPGEQASLDQIEAGLSDGQKNDLHHSLKSAESAAAGNSTTNGPSYRHEGLSAKESSAAERGRAHVSQVKNIKKNWKKVSITYGLVGSVIGIVMAGLLNLMTYKAEFIQNQLETVVGARIEKTVSSRMNRMVASYLAQTLDGLSADACRGAVVTSTCRVPYKGVSQNLFNNWRDVGFENKLKKYGIEIEYDTKNRKGSITYKKTGASQDFDTDGLVERDGGRNTFGRELGRAIDDATEDMHLGNLRRLILRTSARVYAARKLGTKLWCTLACDSRDGLRDKKVGLKNRVKTKFIERVVAPVAPKIGVYMECLVEGCKPDDIRRRVEEITPDRHNNKITKEVSESLAKNISSKNKVSNIIIEETIEKIFKSGTKTAAAKGATKAIPYVGLILLFDTLNEVDKLVDSNAFSQYLADLKIQQYNDAYIFFKQTTDEMNAGALVGEEVDEFNQLYDGFEKSKLYNAGFTPAGNTVLAASTEPCRNGEPVPSDELLCEEQKIPSQVFFEEWRDNAIVGAGLDTTFWTYRNAPTLPVPIPHPTDLDQPYFTGEELIGEYVINNFEKIVGGAADGIINAARAIPPVRQGLDFIADIGASLFEGFVDLFQPVLEDLELKRLIFDSTVAGADLFMNGVMHDQYGLPRITAVEANKLHDEAMKEKKIAFQNKPLATRLFDTRERGSLSNSLVAKFYESPASNSEYGQSVSNVASLLSPNKIFSFFGSLFSQPVFATEQDSVIFGAFGNVQHGVPYDGNDMNLDPKFVSDESGGICEEGSDYLTAWEDSLEYDEFTGEPYYTQANMCAFDQSVSDMASCVWTDAACPGDTGEGAASTSSRSGLVAGVECPANIEPHPFQAGYVKMPDSLDSKYTWDAGAVPAQRYGHEQLVCVLHTVANAYYDLYQGKSMLKIGDLTASGHSSHNIGRAVDLNAIGEIAAADTTRAGYNTEATIALGKLFVDTGVIKNIWWCPNDNSISAINDYAQQRGTPITIKCLPNHHHHFHVDISDEYIIPGNFQP